MIFSINGVWKGKYIYGDRTNERHELWKSGGADFESYVTPMDATAPNEVPFTFTAHDSFFRGIIGEVTDAFIPPHVTLGKASLKGKIMHDRILQFKKSYPKQPEPEELRNAGLVRTRYELWPDGSMQKLTEIESNAYYSGIIHSENEIRGTWIVLPMLWEVGDMKSVFSGLMGTFEMTRDVNEET